MSKRNIVWLVAIVVVGAIVSVAAGWVWGLIAAVAVLVASELIERQVRAKRQAARGVTPGSPLRGAMKSRRQRR